MVRDKIIVWIADLFERKQAKNSGFSLTSFLYVLIIYSFEE